MTKTLGMLLATSLFSISNANAANYTGKISQIWAEPSTGDYVLLVMDGTPTGSNGCTGTNDVYHYAMSITGDMGKALLSMALTAYSAQKEVRVLGAGSCGIHSNVETVENLRLQ